MRAVTDYKEFQGSQLKEHSTEGVATPDATAESKSKVSKKGTPTPAQEKGGKKTPAGARDLATDDPASQEFPEADLILKTPTNTGAHQILPLCKCPKCSQ